MISEKSGIGVKLPRKNHELKTFRPEGTIQYPVGGHPVKEGCESLNREVSPDKFEVTSTKSAGMKEMGKVSQ